MAAGRSWVADSYADRISPSALLLLAGSGAARSCRSFESGLLSRVVVNGGTISRVPIFEMAALACLVEVLAGGEQLVDVLLLDDLEDFEGHVSQRLNLGGPQYRVGIELGFALGRRQLRRVWAGAVVHVAGRRKRSRDFQEVDTFRDGHGPDPDVLPVIVGFREVLDVALRGDVGPDGVED